MISSIAFDLGRQLWKLIRQLVYVRLRNVICEDYLYLSATSQTAALNRALTTKNQSQNSHVLSLNLGVVVPSFRREIVKRLPNLEFL